MENQRSEAEYAVYSVIIDSICSRQIFIEQRRRTVVLLGDSTTFHTLGSAFQVETLPISDSNRIEPAEVFPHWDRVFPGFGIQEIRRDFEDANREHQLIEASRLSTKFSYLPLSRSKIKQLLRHERSPGDFNLPDSILFMSNGVVHLSKVGFNSTLDKAVVHLFHSAYNGGSEYFVMLQKTDGRWKTKDVLISIYI